MPSRMAVFFAFNVLIIAIFLITSFNINNPSTEDLDRLIFSFPHIHEDPELRAQDHDHREATTWADYDDDHHHDHMSDIDDSDECHGYDGYDEDNDDDSSDDDDLDSEDDHDDRDLEMRSDEFIARNYMQRRRDELIYWRSFIQEPNLGQLVS
ncbi:prostatic spermine-binding protein-like [Juglans microcarpa x Juglans regia]|uniref:prostatic spermine-binding protein-like n=1 Tax=Juglans microcarpa x Juglans regia TaxID=2249226 RepID=UPI001B7E8E4E|nr:prostatic spermine-binding protein-like [Juglans microcarpa x Juglans regia]